MPRYNAATPPSATPSNIEDSTKRKRAEECSRSSIPILGDHRSEMLSDGLFQKRRLHAPPNQHNSSAKRKHNWFPTVYPNPKLFQVKIKSTKTYACRSPRKSPRKQTPRPNPRRPTRARQQRPPKNHRPIHDFAPLEVGGIALLSYQRCV
jgi:hypothetical protein